MPATAKPKSTDPADRMGVYKSIGDVPERRRLSQHAAAYDGRDVWSEYLHEHLFDRVTGERGRKDARRVGDRWQAHMDDCGRHHALATPDDVEAWSASLLDELTLRTAYNYWSSVERFYRWMQWHAEFPHLYNPFLMAAAVSGSATRKLWDKKMQRGRSGGADGTDETGGDGNE